MAATLEGDYVSAFDKSELQSQIASLGVSASELVIIPISTGGQVFIGKVTVTP